MTSPQIAHPSTVDLDHLFLRAQEVLDAALRDARAAAEIGDYSALQIAEQKISVLHILGLVSARDITAVWAESDALIKRRFQMRATACVDITHARTTAEEVQRFQQALTEPPRPLCDAED